MPNKRILFFVGDAPFFVSHRLNLVEGAIAGGYDVVVACPTSPATDTIQASGARWVEWKIDRGGTSIIGEVRTFLGAVRIARAAAPTIIHAIALKCILHAGFASKLLRVPIVGAVSGLGYVYTGAARGSKAVLRRLINRFMSIGLNRRNASFIFQNRDDAKMVEFARLDRATVYMIGGSGVDLGAIVMRPHPVGATTAVGLPARLLRDKGVYEFVDAARQLRERGRDARFLLIGDPDPTNPSSVTSKEIESWVADGAIEWQPHTHDISTALAALHIVALPSYREGFPKTIIDASAAGRASVTSDVPGCRDAIVDGVTGILCPAKNGAALADAIDKLILDRNLCIAMGKAARRHAETHFDVREVTARHLEIYRHSEMRGHRP
ncbi:glycosyltransferase family 4 protein [Sphingopyxis sp. XHP0097]|uniref:Glycosyltransferase family 4 protein n=1 Tax=Sphingopyxis jiangsuensis TaxID=2871171 RepID=A0ABS7MAP4_9SPHN|nr:MULTISPECIES: glycosyltransferase family 4 protein [Sphingopyxis]MBL0768205.1 glycosyltransferase family 4 protein [Sphingopyxis lutea]MBY4636080.1 glycosyltransferase family 4 protein [Sphingopyxis jiangsuensis]